MDALTTLLDLIRTKRLSRGLFLGFLNVLIGRRIVAADGTVVSSGLTFRDLANWLKKARWDPEDVKELGLVPDALPLRDRQRYWFVAICQAQVGSEAAMKAGDEFTARLQQEGYSVGTPPKE